MGHTAFIADDRGHLLPGVVKVRRSFIKSGLSVICDFPLLITVHLVRVLLQRGSAWPDFKGTWDLRSGVPAHRVNPTARSEEGLNRLRSWGFQAEHSGGSQSHRGSRGKDMLQVRPLTHTKRTRLNVLITLPCCTLYVYARYAFPADDACSF